jgi:arachidonate 15-lipoxygenase
MASRFPPWELYAPSWIIPYLPRFARIQWHLARKRRAIADDARARGADPLVAAQMLFGDGPFVRASVAAGVLTDEGFAAARVEGPNPLVLERVDASCASARFPGASMCDGDVLFETDYELLRRAHAMGPEARDKHLPAPTALFAERGSPMRLVPLAIRLAPEAPVRVPGDEAWEHAKVCVQVADLNQQVLSAHLYRCHAVAEAFAVTTPRQLAPAHPVRVLLEPHLRFTIMVNHAALGLFREGAVFDNLYAGSLRQTCAILSLSGATWSFRDLFLEADLERRGVASAPVEYPYRDDARLFLAAIRRFCDAYVELYYDTDGAVAGDEELRAWARELVDPCGGALRQVSLGEAITSRDELAEILTHVLFTAGPQHAALHYPQTAYFTAVASFPAALYGAPTELGAPDFLASALPPLERAIEQFETNHIANYRYDRFGDYARYPLGRVEAAAPLVRGLHADLDDVEHTIAARNARRARPYAYLSPSLVPNSVNI